jgi:hypothetical protein
MPAKKKKLNGKAPPPAFDPLATRPKSVALVGLGPSSQDYFAARSSKKDFLCVDEVWGVNSAGNAIYTDKNFVMDDLRHVEKAYPAWAGALRSYSSPIITCRAYADWPNAYEYPLYEVLDTVKDDLFTNTVAYCIGYAIYTNVKELYLFGCDFWYPNSQAVETGLQSVGYLLGIARERGVYYKIPQSSTLLDAHIVGKGPKDEKRGLMRPLYGYHYNPGDSAKWAQMGNATETEKIMADRRPQGLPGKAVEEREVSRQ